MLAKGFSNDPAEKKLPLIGCDWLSSIMCRSIYNAVIDRSNCTIGTRLFCRWKNFKNLQC